MLVVLQVCHTNFLHKRPSKINETFFRTEYNTSKQTKQFISLRNPS